MNHRSNNFDLIRLVAASEVMVHHTMLYFGVGITPLWLAQLFSVWRFFPGVPIFFTISGFLIWRSLDSNDDVKRYARNRGLRIYPGMWVCLIVSLILVLA